MIRKAHALLCLVAFGCDAPAAAVRGELVSPPNHRPVPPPSGVAVEEKFEPDDILLDEEQSPVSAHVDSRHPLDVLFVVDDSPSAADKLPAWREAIYDFVESLVLPPCVLEGAEFDPPDDVLVEFDGVECPEGAKRRHAPMEDVHVALLTSSLGTHGATVEEGADPRCLDSGRIGHLVGASSPDLGVMSMRDEGAFGELEERLAAILGTGCPYEAQLEAAYRFLVDPEPHLSVSRVPCSAEDTSNSCAKPVGVDTELLSQRAAFFQERSQLLVVVFSDENDCSLADGGRGFWSLGNVLARATHACDASANHACCHSCDSPPPDGCSSDPEVTGCGAAPYSDQDLDLPEATSRLRCHEASVGYGMERLYPVSRYVAGFGSVTIAGRDGTEVANPLLERLAPTSIALTFVVGTPWQDVAREGPAGQRVVRNATYLDWSRFLLDPAASEEFDPLNLESVSVRDGIHPVTGEPLGSASEVLNSLNGFDRDFQPGDGEGDDLQHACLVDVGEAAECESPGASEECPCLEAGAAGVEPSKVSDPVCVDSFGEPVTAPERSKAFPGTRFMEVARELATQSTLGSVCFPSSPDWSSWEYGQRPTLWSLVYFTQASDP